MYALTLARNPFKASVCEANLSVRFLKSPISRSTMNTSVTALDFGGVGGLSSTSAITGLNTALQLLSGWIQEKPPIAASAVAAYESAVSSMIPAAVSIANRAEQAADVALNPVVLGALTPAIVALDTEYFGEHWPHNASCGAAYGAALAALVAALAVPPPLSPPGASPAAPATAAAALAQTAGQVAAGEAMKESGQIAKMTGDSTAAPAGAAGQVAAAMGQPIQSVTGAAAQPLMGMFQAPMQALQGLTGVTQSMVNSPGGPIGTLSANDVALPAAEFGIAGLPGSAGGSVGALGGAGTGAVSIPVGGAPGAGLTTYTRPTTSFAPEGSGRPAGLKTGLLSAAEHHGPTTNGVAGGSLPVAPGTAGMLPPGKAQGAQGGAAQARVVLTEARRPPTRTS